MLVALHPIIHSPNASNRVTFSLDPRGRSNSPIFFPRWKTQTPLSDSGRAPPQAASTTFFHARVAVISSGVCGLVRNTRCRPFFKSYVCRDRPTEVVIWKVALPSGREVKGTLVGDTRPTVWRVFSAFLEIHRPRKAYSVWSENSRPEQDSAWRLLAGDLELLALRDWPIGSIRS